MLKHWFNFSVILEMIILLSGCSFFTNPTENSEAPQIPYGTLQVLTVSAGVADSGGYFPLEWAFDHPPVLDEAQIPVSTASHDGFSNVPSFGDRYGYIDFGENFASCRITQTWTCYKDNTTGDQTPFQELWWDPNSDTLNNKGYNENTLNFNTAAGLNGTEDSWLLDVDVSDNPIIPRARYLILHSADPMTAQAREFAFVGYRVASEEDPDFPAGSSIRFDLEFSSAPGNVSLAVAPLRYNKKIAYSMTFDDGLATVYKNAYPLMEGGLIVETGEMSSGLFYTDGCGNPIPFRSGLAWNSVGSQEYQEIHSSGYSYISWDQLREMLASDWELINHGWSHRTSDVDYYDEISLNYNRVLSETGYKMTHFVAPTGVEEFLAPAFELGIKAAHGNKWNWLGLFNGVDVSEPLYLNDAQISRKFMNSGFNAAEDERDVWLTWLEDVADRAVNDDLYLWVSTGSHGAGNYYANGSMYFPSFQYYMEYMEDTYGKDGSDILWMAPVQSVYEYLEVKDAILLTTEWNGTTLSVTLDYSGVPKDLRTYAVSLLINQQYESISNVSSRVGTLSENGTLINLEWAP